jgi:hypothetical protein
MKRFTMPVMFRQNFIREKLQILISTIHAIFTLIVILIFRVHFMNNAYAHTLLIINKYGINIIIDIERFKILTLLNVIP